MMVVVTIGLIIAISLAVIAFYQYKEAKEQKDIAIKNEELAKKQEKNAKAQTSTSRSRELAAYAWLALEQDPTLSFRLAEAAIKEKPTLLARKTIMAPLTFPLHNFLGKHEGYVTSTVFSPDGKRIVTASSDRTARVWETETGNPLHVLKGHEDRVRSAVFSPDGKRIVTASSDRTARVWETETGNQLHVLKGHEDVLRSAVFSPDGKRIVTASDDRTARVWPAGYQEVLQAVNVDQIRGVVRQLTAEELERYGFDHKNEQ
jgi:WD40 repeat protein